MTARSKLRSKKRVAFHEPQEPPSSESDEDNTCRCICNANNPTAKRPWIQRTACNAWQHNDCMDISVFDDELGDHYWCEECAPEMHAALLEAVDRREKPWEERVRRRLEVKAGLEGRVMAVLGCVGWLWEFYEVQPGAVAGREGVVPVKRAAPGGYVDAVRAGLGVLFEDLPMLSLRELAEELEDGDGGRHDVMKALRRNAAREYDESDVRRLGVLSELFGWAEKGRLYSG